LRCISPNSCPIGYYADYLVNKMCVTKCSSPYWGVPQTKKCELYCLWNPPNLITFYDSSTRVCVKQCPANPRTFSLNSTQTCVNPCPSGFYGSILTY
jgi:hypothetical protein